MNATPQSLEETQEKPCRHATVVRQGPRGPTCDKESFQTQSISTKSTYQPKREKIPNPMKQASTPIHQWIEKSRAGNSAAFTKLVEQYQNLALGFAFSKLGDFYLAQDVVQDSFVIAFNKLDQLQTNEAFPSWLRGIVHLRCHRMFRNMSQRKRIQDSFTSSVLETKPEEVENQESKLSSAQSKDMLLKAIQALPEEQRTVITLYYLEEQSQKEVAKFLSLPVSKVNNVLHQARTQLKRRLLTMAQDTFYEQRLNEEFAKNIGEIVRIQGSLVETRATSDGMGVLDVVGTRMENQASGTDLMVVQRSTNGTYKCIAFDDDVSNNAKVTPQPQRSGFPGTVSDNAIRSALDHLKTQQSDSEILETGIKTMDLFCPVPKGATVGIFGKEGVGRMVFLQEMIHRMKDKGDPLHLVFFVNRWNLPGTQDMIESEPILRNDHHGCLDTAWVLHPKAADPNYALQAKYLEVGLYFNPILATQQLWPALDPLRSFSTSLSPEGVGERHYKLAMEAKALLSQSRELIKDADFLEMLVLDARDAAVEQLSAYEQRKIQALSNDEREIVHRARCLERYLTQPFYVAEDFTNMSGNRVSREELLSDVEQILRGGIDSQDPETLRWLGGLSTTS